MDIANRMEETSALYLRNKEELKEKGWTLLSDVKNEPLAVLKCFGTPILQFNGKITFEVTQKAGFEKLPYSQSQNAIGAHTEAPVYNPPPKYLVLYCHTQAKCGGGQTLLADGFAFLNSLPEKLRHYAETEKIVFSANSNPDSPGQKQTFAASIYTKTLPGAIFRFSYNLFHYGDVNPTEKEIETLKLNYQEELKEIAQLGETFFTENVIPILIPEGYFLIWDNHRLMHARGNYKDPNRHLTRYWLKQT